MVSHSCQSRSLDSCLTSRLTFTVRFGFRNGSDTDPFNFTYYPLFASSSLDTNLDVFISNLSPYLLPNTTSWCHACSQNSTSGCDVVAMVDSLQSQLSKERGGMSAAEGGGIGFGVTFVVMMALLGG